MINAPDPGTPTSDSDDGGGIWGKVGNILRTVIQAGSAILATRAKPSSPASPGNANTDPTIPYIAGQTDPIRYQAQTAQSFIPAGLTVNPVPTVSPSAQRSPLRGNVTATASNTIPADPGGSPLPGQQQQSPVQPSTNTRGGSQNGSGRQGSQGTFQVNQPDLFGNTVNPSLSQHTPNQNNLIAGGIIFPPTGINAVPYSTNVLLDSAARRSASDQGSTETKAQKEIFQKRRKLVKTDYTQKFDIQLIKIKIELDHLKTIPGARVSDIAYSFLPTHRWDLQSQPGWPKEKDPAVFYRGKIVSPAYFGNAAYGFAMREIGISRIDAIRIAEDFSLISRLNLDQNYDQQAIISGMDIYDFHNPWHTLVPYLKTYGRQ